MTLRNSGTACSERPLCLCNQQHRGVLRAACSHPQPSNLLCCRNFGASQYFLPKSFICARLGHADEFEGGSGITAKFRASVQNVHRKSRMTCVHCHTCKRVKVRPPTHGHLPSVFDLPSVSHLDGESRHIASNADGGKFLRLWPGRHPTISDTSRGG